jgi:predicted RNase H-like nuclease (RuvC/YqgF family)
MADLKKTYDDLVKSNEELGKKFGAYVDASDYHGKKDFKKWLGELQKATKELEDALADTKSKLAAMKKALEDFVKLHKAELEKDKDAMGALRKISEVMSGIEENTKKVQRHLDYHKA